MPGADSGGKKFLTRVPALQEDAKGLYGPLLGRRLDERRIEMPIGVTDDLCAEAQGTENDKDIFDIGHGLISSMGRSRRAHAAANMKIGAYQEMPYFAAIRRAFASSLE